MGKNSTTHPLLGMNLSTLSSIMTSAISKHQSVAPLSKEHSRLACPPQCVRRTLGPCWRIMTRAAQMRTQWTYRTTKMMTFCRLLKCNYLRSYLLIQFCTRPGSTETSSKRMRPPSFVEMQALMEQVRKASSRHDSSSSSVQTNIDITINGDVWFTGEKSSNGSEGPRTKPVRLSGGFRQDYTKAF